MKPRSVNMNIDTGEKTWLTPRHIIDALGPFDTDPCVPDGGMPWRTATRMITKSEDGLKADWTGHVWLNPPYGREALPFFKRMVEHKEGGIALVFVRTDTELWQDYIFPYATAILFIRGRLRFCHQDGTPGTTATAPSALVAYGADGWGHTQLFASKKLSKINGRIVAVQRGVAWEKPVQ